MGSRNRKTMGFPAEKNDGMVGDTTGFDLGASISLVASSARPVATRPANRAAFRAPLPPNLELNKHKGLEDTPKNHSYLNPKKN